ncbi:MAG: alanine racemase [Candidatus Omnitrophica bacterium]|nr:alanine racemase [Candidatus Omnitrophota bacterium]MDE2008461.1 alanine racemase [Candidatus Omnitrophota bacterium]MDE2214799.1 alanine racemase [Candidatus Omnitrophota bacterium]MDE2231418.1 alanine racemase [Candidatus Omnitrophota bacterium]
MNVKILNYETVVHPPTWCELDLEALTHNFEQLQKLSRKNMTHALGIMPVIKADAYGHGMMQVAEALNACGCRYWTVSNAGEALSLRAMGFKQKILLIESTLTCEAKDIVAYNLTPTVCDLAMAYALDQCACAAGIRLGVHIKVDTGMGRLGVSEEQVMDFVDALLSECPHLVLEGIYTHFPLADTDRDFTVAQMRRFRDIVYALENRSVSFTFVHASNSMGLGDYKSDLFNLARPGIMLYGIYPREDLKQKVQLKPVMSVKSRIIFVQPIAKGRGISYGHTFKAKEDMLVAILPVGYSNGYLRSLSNKAFVLVCGVRCPVVGRVTMDQIIVDITPVTLSGRTPVCGDEAVLLGAQKGASIDADELAQWADTISYEILCSLGNRLPRVFHPPPVLPSPDPGSNS